MTHKWKHNEVYQGLRAELTGVWGAGVLTSFFWFLLALLSEETRPDYVGSEGKMAVGLKTWKELISCDIGKVQRLSLLESTDSWQGIRRKDNIHQHCTCVGASQNPNIKARPDGRGFNALFTREVKWRHRHFQKRGKGCLFGEINGH